MSARFFIDRPIFAWVIAIAIMITGLLALRHLPVAQYPEVAPPQLSITATYPGASAAVIEETVTALIEQEMNGIDDLLYMDSSSDASGTMALNLTFHTGTNLDMASVEAQNRIKRVEARLPEEVRRQGLQVAKSRRNFLLFITLFSPDGSYDRTALGSYAKANLVESLRRVQGVGDVLLFGSEYAMRIWLDADRLAVYSLSPSDVLRAVRNQNVQLATGEIGSLPAEPGQQLTATVVANGRLSTPQQFRDIVLRADNRGGTVHLGDVARVELGAADYTMTARLNGQPTAAMGIKLASDGNALATSRAVKAKMQELGMSLPKGHMDWRIPYDTSRFVEISIQEVIKTLIEAMLLVFLVMFVFLQNIRATFIPAIVVPIALTGAFIGLYLLGYSINVLTLFGMVLAIGIVVDDAIVVVENVERLMRDEGLSPYAATHKAMSQIINAIVAITLVLVAVFVPMAFFGGSTGAIYRQFSVTMVLTMAFSALLALTLTPALCASLLKPHDGHKGFFAAFNTGFERLTGVYVARVGRIVLRPLRFMALFGVLCVITAVLFLRLPGGFLPEEDQGYFLTLAQLPPGATQERTLAVVDKIEQFYLRQPEVAHTVGIAGFSFFGRGQNAAMVFTRLKDWDERKQPQSQIQALVMKANMALFGTPEAMVFALNVPPIPELAAIGGFDFRLEDRGGLGRAALQAARNQMLGMAMQSPLLMGVRPEGLEDAPQVTLAIDTLKAAAMQIDRGQINDALAIALGSAYVNDFVHEGRILRVIMQMDSHARRTADDLLRVQVRNADGAMVPLASFATAGWQSGPPKLDRYNGFASMKIAGQAALGRSTGEAMAEMEKLAATLPKGIGFEWSGQSLEEQMAGTQAPFLFALSLLVVFLCLAALYESLSIPVAVMLVVPLGVLGAVCATWLRFLPNDVYFKVGLIAIIGLAAKNAILIIEFARAQERTGCSPLQAVVEAARLRLRPILMTSIAFVFGVLPLAISSGAGAASRHAIGTGVIGGMIGATVLAIFLVPVFYVVIRRLLPGKSSAHEKDTV